MWLNVLFACAGPSPDHRPGPTDAPTETAAPAPSDPPSSALLSFAGPVPRNVLMITLDTTRWDRIGRYGGTSTPELDTFLTGAVALDAHRSCSNWTGPSMSCLLSGRMPADAGFWPLSQEPGIPAIPPLDWETFPGRLSDAGWSTRLLSANPVLGTQPRYGDLARGYDEVSNLQWMNAPELTALAADTAAELTAGAEPWLLHVHYVDPHGPYCPPVELLDTSGLPAFAEDICADFYSSREGYWDQTPEWQAAFTAWSLEYYRAEIAAWDAAFGDLIDELDRLGALDDTLVVVATDHGEQFGERNAFGHGILLGPEETRAVGALWAKNLAPATWPHPTFHSDLAATLYDLYDLDPGAPLDGVTVGTAPENRGVPIWNLGSGIGAEELAENWGGTAEVYLSIVLGETQLNYDWDGNRAFYRLDSDPGGLADVYDPADPAVIAAWAPMMDVVAEVQAFWPQLGPPVAAAP